jgi:hypothetical protein
MHLQHKSKSVNDLSEKYCQPQQTQEPCVGKLYRFLTSEQALHTDTRIL